MHMYLYLVFVMFLVWILNTACLIQCVETVCIFIRPVPMPAVVCVIAGVGKRRSLWCVVLIVYARFCVLFTFLHIVHEVTTSWQVTLTYFMVLFLYFLIFNINPFSAIPVLFIDEFCFVRCHRRTWRHNLITLFESSQTITVTWITLCNCVHFSPVYVHSRRCVYAITVLCVCDHGAVCMRSECRFVLSRM